MGASWFLCPQAKFPETNIKTISKRVDGKFLGPGGSSVPTGQAILTGLLEACFEICQDIKARDAEEDVSPPLKPIWERLTEMKAQLERLRGYRFPSLSPRLSQLFVCPLGARTVWML